MNILRMSAAVEGATGVVLMLLPGLVVHLLFGAEVAGAGLAAARIAGMALVALGIACWPSSLDGRSGHGWTAMLVYNVLVTIYLVGMGVSGEPRGIALWPATFVHAVVTVALVQDRARRKGRG